MKKTKRGAAPKRCSYVQKVYSYMKSISLSSFSMKRFDNSTPSRNVLIISHSKYRHSLCILYLILERESIMGAMCSGSTRLHTSNYYRIKQREHCIKYWSFLHFSIFSILLWFSRDVYELLIIHKDNKYAFDYCLY